MPLTGGDPGTPTARQPVQKAGARQLSARSAARRSGSSGRSRAWRRFEAAQERRVWRRMSRERAPRFERGSHGVDDARLERIEVSS